MPTDDNKLRKSNTITLFQSDSNDKNYNKLKKEIEQEVKNELKEKPKDPNDINTFISQLPAKLRRSLEAKFVEEAMFADFYAGTFYSMITKYKKKHNLLLENQTEYYFESIFLLFVQATFCVCVLLSIDWKDVTSYTYEIY
jgi:hypothetical protein